MRNVIILLSIILLVGCAAQSPKQNLISDCPIIKQSSANIYNRKFTAWHDCNGNLHADLKCNYQYNKDTGYIETLNCEPLDEDKNKPLMEQE